MSTIADTFLLSGLIPCGVQVCPKKLTFLHLNCILSSLNTTPFCCALSMNLVRFLSCSTSDDPYTNVSSAIPMTPPRPSNAVSRCF